MSRWRRLRRARRVWARRARLLAVGAVMVWWAAAANAGQVTRWSDGLGGWTARWSGAVGGACVVVTAACVAGLVAILLDARRRAGVSPLEFERLVGRLLGRDGCSGVVAGGGAGDLGRDVRAVDPAGRLLIVQCKRYGPNNPVGSEAIQAFLGTFQRVHHADVGLFVTTSRFTRAARELGEQQGLILVDGTLLRRWERCAWSPLPAARRAA